VGILEACDWFNIDGLFCSKYYASKTKSITKFGPLHELVTFFENHDMGEYWEQMPEAHFDIDIKRRTQIFSLDEDLAETLTKIAREKRIPSSTLINEWLREKVMEQAKATP